MNKRILAATSLAAIVISMPIIIPPAHYAAEYVRECYSKYCFRWHKAQSDMEFCYALGRWENDYD